MTECFHKKGNQNPPVPTTERPAPPKGSSGRGVVWIAGHAYGVDGWAIEGVFDEERAAVDACYSPECFVGPIEFNVRLPKEMVDWPGAYYPLAEAEA